MEPIHDVPVTIVTGFLGVGKTTAIRKLLAEREDDGPPWAVLVNEFGEVGIDGALLSEGEVAVTEIPGGCICCTAGVNLQMSLVRILREVRPGRVFIEPTGLAHPATILDMLRRQGMRDAVSVRATITLVDPRRLDEPRVRESATFNDQVTVADVLVANKTDLCTDEDLERFRAFAAEIWPQPVVVAEAAHGALDPAWLDLDPRPRQTRYVPVDAHGHELHSGMQADSCGFIWGPEVQFDRLRLHFALQELVLPGLLPEGALRVKGLFRTPGAWLAIQASPDEVATEPTGWRRDSRVELIAPAGEAIDWEAVRERIEEAVI